MPNKAPAPERAGHLPEGRLYQWLWRHNITPNKITVGRLAAVPIISWLICLAKQLLLQGHTVEGVICAILAVVLFILDAYTDRVDGRLARRSGQITLLGKFLDPTVDKGLILLTLLVVVIIYHPYSVEWWSAWGLVTAFELSSTLLRTWVARRVDPSAQWWGKAKLVIQVVLTGLILVFSPLELLFPSASSILVLSFIVTLTFVTVASDIATITRLVMEHNKATSKK